MRKRLHFLLYQQGNGIVLQLSRAYRLDALFQCLKAIIVFRR